MTDQTTPAGVTTLLLANLVLRLTIGGTQTTRRITADPDEVAQEVHRHVRGILDGARVDIHLDPDALTGTITSHGATAGTFTLTPIEQQPEQPGQQREDGIRWGWTLHDLHIMAASACRADRSMASDATTRYDTAWSAIAEHLYTATTPPTFDDLVRAGWQAIYTEVRQVRHLYGIPRDSDRRTGGVASAPRFATYWRALPTDSAEDALTERVAVHQIVGTLTPAYREAVEALAALDDYQAAADALGIRYEALTARLRTARRHLRALWFAPETAPPPRGTDRRVGVRGRPLATHCKAGHAWTPGSTRWDTGRSGRKNVRRCRICERDRATARRARTKAAA